jgi:hypothetical protein
MDNPVFIFPRFDVLVSGALTVSPGGKLPPEQVFDEKQAF